VNTKLPTTHGHCAEPRTWAEVYEHVDVDGNDVTLDDLLPAVAQQDLRDHLRFAY
jgi:hypothetical protein